MSRESALAVATGQPTPSPTPAVTEVPSLPQATDTPPPAEPPVSSSKAFAHLAKKEAEIVKARQELQAERQKLDPVIKQYQEYETLKKTDPIGALKFLGFSETDIFNYMAAQQPVELTPEQKAAQAAETAAQASIKAFEDSQLKKEQDAQKKADDAVIQNYRGGISKAITENPEKFEYCKYHGPLAEELIYETVLAIVEDSKGEDVPTPEEAAQLVEDFYEEQDRAMSSLKKRQPKETVPATPPEKTPPTRTRTVSEPTAPTRPARTLTNSTTSTVASTRVKVNETATEKRERLMERLRNGN